MKITQFDRTNLKLITEDIKRAFETIEEKFGIKLNYKNASFSPSSVTFKFDGATIGNNGIVETKERNAFKTYGSMYGLTVDMLDKEISYGYTGKTYIIKGLNTRSPKFNVIATDVSNGVVRSFNKNKIPTTV